jgi:hypothetical protein
LLSYCWRYRIPSSSDEEGDARCPRARGCASQYVVINASFIIHPK